MLNDKGEGRYISLRGLDPELNNTNIDGIRLPSPEGATGAVALDTIPSDLIESIEIIKTLTPDMDADTIGGTIRINTFSALDQKDHIKFVVQSYYNDLGGEHSPEYSGDFSTVINERFGVAGGFAVSRREVAADNAEMSDWVQAGNGIIYPQDVQFRVYDNRRERQSANLKAEFRATDNTSLYAQGIYNRFDDTEHRSRVRFRLNDLEPFAGSDRGASFLSGDGDERIEVRRDLTDRLETQKVNTFSVGGETTAGDWIFNYSLSYAKASETEHDALDPTRFRNRFTAGQLGVDFGYPSLDAPTYAITTGQDAFYDPDVFGFNTIETVLGKAQDDETALQFDTTRLFHSAEAETAIKAGFKLRMREKSFEFTRQEINDFDGDYRLTDVLGKTSHSLALVDPVPDVALTREFFRDNESRFLSVQLDYADSNGEDYKVDEDIAAAYLMGRHETERWLIAGGVRVEYTDDAMKGKLVDEDAETSVPQTFANDYLHVLPSLSLRFAAADDVVMRGGVFRSLVRPRINKLAPRFKINEDFEAKFGNPDLKAYEAWNVDASVEYYFSEASVVQAGVFYKYIDNFIIDKTFAAADAPYFGEYNGITFNEAEIAINGDQATVAGLELSFSRAFDSGFLLGLNYTYTDTEGDVADRTITLPSASEHTFNLIVGYDKGPFSTRFTIAHRSDYFDELGSNPDEDRYIDEHTQMDFSAAIDVSSNVEAFVKLANINDEPFVAYQPGPAGKRLQQYEEYSWTGKFGIKVKL